MCGGASISYASKCSSLFTHTHHITSRCSCLTRLHIYIYIQISLFFFLCGWVCGLYFPWFFLCLCFVSLCPSMEQGFSLSRIPPLFSVPCLLRCRPLFLFLHVVPPRHLSLLLFSALFHASRAASSEEEESSQRCTLSRSSATRLLVLLTYTLSVASVFSLSLCHLVRLFVCVC